MLGLNMSLPPVLSSLEWPLPGQDPASFRILIVDDDRLIRVGLKAILRKAGFQCLEASHGQEALERVAATPVDLILTDLAMPLMDGLELVKAVAPMIPDLAVVVVTGSDDLEKAMDCLRMHAYGYVIKPFNPNAILIAVANALRRRMLELDFRDREDILNRKVREQTQEIRESRLEIALRLLSASEHRDRETGAHIRRIGLYAAELGRLLGWSEEQVDRMLSAAPMHDIGKIGVPDRILQKEGRLTAAEWKVMRTHTAMGSQILQGSRVPFIEMGARIAACHHEKWDGSGYPAGLKGEEIPLEARITALVDTYDALMNHRHYKEAWPETKVLAYLGEEAGRHFDPGLVEVFLPAADRFRTILETHPDEPKNLDDWDEVAEPDPERAPERA